MLGILVITAQPARSRTYLCQFPVTVSFADRSVELGVAAQRELALVAGGQCRPAMILGYADPEEGSSPTMTARLALARAEAVAAFLMLNGMIRDGVAVRGGDADRLREAGAMGAPAERNRIARVVFHCCEGSPISSDSRWRQR